MSLKIKNFALLSVVLVTILSSCTDSKSTKTVVLNNHQFKVELATTPAEREEGLMQRTELETDHGMLFVFDPPEKVNFWMKNTLIPLDILYFDTQKKLIQVFQNVRPCETERCETYPSHSAIKYVLELPAKTVEKIGVKLGETLITDNS